MQKINKQVKKVEESNTMGKTGDVFKKIRDSKGTFHVVVGTVKDRNSMPLREAKILRRGGKIIQKNCTKKDVMTQITMMMLSLTWSQKSWSVKSSGHHYKQS